MTATLKYILVALILYYLWNNHLKKIVNVFFKKSSHSNGNSRRSSNDAFQQRQYKQAEPKVTSRKQNTSSTAGKEFKGGEYIDFEEVE